MNGALQIGRSALLTSQAALQVAGDNMANAATRGFHRRSIHLTPAPGQRINTGQFIGRGVNLLGIHREVDTALQLRLRTAVSHERSAQIDQQFLSALESLQNELGDNDLSSQLSAFFNSFSELANNPSDIAVRGLVIQKGQALAGRITELRAGYNQLIGQIDQSLGSSVTVANDLLSQIAAVNEQIVSAELGQGEASSLRDHRDVLLEELAQKMDISVIEQSNGAVDVLVGSTPIVLGATSRGLTLHTTSVGGKLQVAVRVAADGTKLEVQSGAIGGLLKQRAQTVEPAIKAIDDFAAQLIFQVNRVHSQGQGLKGFTSVTGAYTLGSATDAMNSSAAGLPFRIENGSFFVHVTHVESGVRIAHEINVNGDTTSLQDLVVEINTVTGGAGATAEIGPGNTLKLSTTAGHEISFSDDSSGALAALGINTFFTGSRAGDIGINQVIIDDPSMLAAGEGHVEGSAGTAVALANLQDEPIAAMGNRSLREFWQKSVSELAVKTQAAHSAAETTRLVRQSLDAQALSVSGVSLDEEAINLLMFQRQFQAAARYIGVIDETLQTLMRMV
jgi:flagellar hook-associated protein 1